VRKLSLTDTVFVGLAAMLGAGVFVVFGPAAALAGDLLPISIFLAATVAYLNAGSVAQLAKVVDRSGGGYAYGRAYISNSAGFLAGTSFIVGKIGSSSAIALTVSGYLFPEQAIAVAVAGIVAMTAINLLGINRTALGSKILASVTIAFLLVLIFYSAPLPAAEIPLGSGSVMGVLSAAALFFFAYAGYARVATIGGEVKNSTKVIPQAIWISLSIVLTIYLLLALVLSEKLGTLLTRTTTPIADLTQLSWDSINLTAFFAALAGLGSLLALLAGMSRTAAEMALDGELPKSFQIKLKNGAPVVSELVIASLAILLTVFGSILLSLGISSFCVLFYYAITNLAAFRQPVIETKRPKFLNLVGLALCLVLALSVPSEGLLVGALLLVLALGLRWGLRRIR
jgi:APA family basic amino acid/polyamine antiporter